MKITNLTILLTENCNYNCKYCYQRKNQNNDIEPLIAKKVVEYALKNSDQNLNIIFSGGEPLLKFNLINKCIYYLKRKGDIFKKKINFSIITNGSLINDGILEFLDDNKFEIQYSFDVYLKNKKSEFEKFNNGKKILRKLVNTENISLSTNTVFTPDKSDTIFDSVEFLYNENVKNIGIGIDQTSYWDKRSISIFEEELKKVKELIFDEYLKTGSIINGLFNLKEPPGINMCGGGGNKMIATPNGELWGCSAFYYYNWENSIEKKENYYYGKVEDLNNGNFEKKSYDIRSNHKEFTTDNFKTDSEKCFLCDYLMECRLCPAQKYSFLNNKRSMFQVPDQVCKMNKIIFKINNELKKNVKGIESL